MSFSSTDDHPSAGPGDSSAVDMTQSQRALELRKFFEPFDPILSETDRKGLNVTIDSDGALSAYAEAVIWRLRGVRAMVTLIDRETQYFIAGAARDGTAEDSSVLHDGTWFGCDTAPTPGSLCENTLAIRRTTGNCSCFIVEDLRSDPRFVGLPIVDGTVAAYRFYAGTPITTENGINIGSFFMFDDKPRPGGLSLEQRRFLFESASNVMRHLETKREAAERRRVVLMGRGIAQFLEKTSQVTEEGLDKTAERHASSSTTSDHIAHGQGLMGDGLDERSSEEAAKSASAKILDKIKLTLDHAANILRESFELTAGGVVFLDTAIGYSDSGEESAYFDISVDHGGGDAENKIHRDNIPSGLMSNTPAGGTSQPWKGAFCRGGSFLRGGTSPSQVRGFNDQYRAAKILAISASDKACWDQSSKALDQKTLQSLIDAYPKGNVWYIDDEGYFSSLEQVAQLCERDQRVEANLLARVFKRARQIIFLPLWDVGGNRWHSGCFVWSQSAVPVFTVDSELAFVSAFTNSVMAEISRLNAITADKIKSDFISSISHEFRSPLHGILASAELLRESELDPIQAEFISTIQSCGSTLLDTINHVLDYSKINSFEKKGGDTGKLSSGLWQNSNVALLCEEIVNGMMAANEFQRITDSPQNMSGFKQQDLQYNPVDIILDFEHRDWNHRVQSGALRRIVMNIFGNAQKYTESGFILVQLGVREAEESRSTKRMLVLSVIDSGRGMSTEYMERKLYTPFAQEDAFAPGVGLGLSIVWSIVNQLGGKIHIRSERGKGTDVEVILPLEDWEAGELSRRSDDRAYLAGAQHYVETLRKIAVGKNIAFYQQDYNQESPRSSSGLAWQCVKKYCKSWFGFNICCGNEDERALLCADLVIQLNSLGSSRTPDTLPIKETTRTLVIYDGATPPSDRKSREQNRRIQSIGGPVGPYKLARALLELFREQVEKSSSDTDVSIAYAFSEGSTRNSMSSISLPPSREEINVECIDPGTSVLEPTKISQGLETSESTQLQQLTTLNGTATDVGLRQIPQDVPVSLYSSHDTFQPVSLGTAPAPDSSLSGAQASLRLLLVDDNPLNLQLLHRYLLKRKLDTVVVARNGVEAFATVRQAKTPFDIIFMDISMPEMDGFEATRLIRAYERSIQHQGFKVETLEANSTKHENERALQETGTSLGDSCNAEAHQGGKALEDREVIQARRDSHHAYVVALTGLASRRDRDHAEQCGFDEYLTKPISFSKIGELLARLSAEKMQL